jgi:hypothetical protein
VAGTHHKLHSSISGEIRRRFNRKNFESNISLFGLHIAGDGWRKIPSIRKDDDHRIVAAFVCLKVSFELRISGLEHDLRQPVALKINLVRLLDVRLGDIHSTASEHAANRVFLFRCHGDWLCKTWLHATVPPDHCKSLRFGSIGELHVRVPTFPSHAATQCTFDSVGRWLVRPSQNVKRVGLRNGVHKNLLAGQVGVRPTCWADHCDHSRLAAPWKIKQEGLAGAFARGPRRLHRPAVTAGYEGQCRAQDRFAHCSGHWVLSSVHVRMPASVGICVWRPHPVCGSAARPARRVPYTRRTKGLSRSFSERRELETPQALSGLRRGLRQRTATWPIGSTRPIG